MLTKTLSKRYFDEHVSCLPGIYGNTKAAPETLKFFSQTVDVLFRVAIQFGANLSAGRWFRYAPAENTPTLLNRR
jgi:hypothetical protein